MEYILKKILKNPKKVLLFYLFSFLISLFAIHSNLKINTSTDSLINKNLDFKLNQQKLKKSFRVLNNNILIRIKGNESNQINLLGEKIITELKSYDGIDFVYSPSSDKFFKENFFLFLNDLEKENLIQKIYNFQPFLSQINNHQNKLEGFNSLLELSLKENSLENLSEFSNIFERFTSSLKSKEILKWNKLIMMMNFTTL